MEPSNGDESQQKHGKSKGSTNSMDHQQEEEDDGSVAGAASLIPEDKLWWNEPFNSKKHIGSGRVACGSKENEDLEMMGMREYDGYGKHDEAWGLSSSSRQERVTKKMLKKQEASSFVKLHEEIPEDREIRQPPPSPEPEHVNRWLQRPGRDLFHRAADDYTTTDDEEKEMVRRAIEFSLQTKEMEDQMRRENRLFPLDSNAASHATVRMEDFGQDTEPELVLNRKRRVRPKSSGQAEALPPLEETEEVVDDGAEVLTYNGPHWVRKSGRDKPMLTSDELEEELLQKVLAASLESKLEEDRKFTERIRKKEVTGTGASEACTSVHSQVNVDGTEKKSRLERQPVPKSPAVEKPPPTEQQEVPKVPRKRNPRLCYDENTDNPEATSSPREDVGSKQPLHVDVGVGPPMEENPNPQNLLALEKPRSSPNYSTRAALRMEHISPTPSVAGSVPNCPQPTPQGPVMDETKNNNMTEAPPNPVVNMGPSVAFGRNLPPEPPPLHLAQPSPGATWTADWKPPLSAPMPILPQVPAMLTGEPPINMSNAQRRRRLLVTPLEQGLGLVPSTAPTSPSVLPPSPVFPPGLTSQPGFYPVQMNPAANIPYLPAMPPQYVPDGMVAQIAAMRPMNNVPMTPPLLTQEQIQVLTMYEAMKGQQQARERMMLLENFYQQTMLQRAPPPPSSPSLPP